MSLAIYTLINMARYAFLRLHTTTPLIIIISVEIILFCLYCVGKPLIMRVIIKHELHYSSHYSTQQQIRLSI